MPVPGQVAHDGPQIGSEIGLYDLGAALHQAGERLLGDVFRVVRSQQPRQAHHFQIAQAEQLRYVRGGAEPGTRLSARHATYTPLGGKGCLGGVPMSL